MVNKKRIISLIFALFVLFGTNQTRTFETKHLALGGAILTTALVITMALGKKYVYDPLATMVKYRKYLAPQYVQDLSNRQLDQYLKTDNGGLSKQLLVQYLKTFGYNRVYVNEKIFENSSDLTYGIYSFSGGIFIKPFDLNANIGLLIDIVNHENRHLYNGDATKLIKKFGNIFYNYLLKSLNILKKKSIQAGTKEVEKQIISKMIENEYLTTRADIKNLFESGHFRTFFQLSHFSKAEKRRGDFDEYTEGRIAGFEDIARENPDHPVIRSTIKLDNAVEKEILAQKEFNDAKQKKLNTIDETKQKLQIAAIELDKAKKELVQIIDKMDTQISTLEKQINKSQKPTDDF